MSIRPTSFFTHFKQESSASFIQFLLLNGTFNCKSVLVSRDDFHICRRALKGFAAHHSGFKQSTPTLIDLSHLKQSSFMFRNAKAAKTLRVGSILFRQFCLLLNANTMCFQSRRGIHTNISLHLTIAEPICFYLKWLLQTPSNHLKHVINDERTYKIFYVLAFVIPIHIFYHSTVYSKLSCSRLAFAAIATNEGQC